MDEQHAIEGMSPEAVEQWLRSVAVPAADELEKDPSRGRTLDEVKSSISASSESLRDAA